MAILGNLAVLHLDRQFDWTFARHHAWTLNDHPGWCAVHYCDPVTLGHTADDLRIPANHAGIVLTS